MPALLVVVMVIFSFSSFYSQTKTAGLKMEIKLESNSFKNGEHIPSKFTIDGENISPQLKWSNGPADTKSYAIINDDPDAPIGDWVHWIIYNIPLRVNELKENISPLKLLPDGSMHGMNDFKKFGYGGPAPPSGTHRYYFKIYALDVILKLEPGASKTQLLKAMQGHILGTGQILGLYKRK